MVSRSRSPRLALGLLGVEPQFQTSHHTFEGRRYRDTCTTLGVRLWPVLLITGQPSLRGN